MVVDWQLIGMIAGVALGLVMAVAVVWSLVHEIQIEPWPRWLSSILFVVGLLAVLLGHDWGIGVLAAALAVWYFFARKLPTPPEPLPYVGRGLSEHEEFLELDRIVREHEADKASLSSDND